MHPDDDLHDAPDDRPSAPQGDAPTDGRANGDSASVTAPNGAERPVLRDPVSGRMLPGSAPLNPAGRPKGESRPRLHDVARRAAEARGLDLDVVLEGIVLAMAAKATKGDVDAARLVLGRLAVDEAAPALLQVVPGDSALQVPKAPQWRAMAADARGMARRSVARGEADLVPRWEAHAAVLDAQATALELAEAFDDQWGAPAVQTCALDAGAQGDAAPGETPDEPPPAG